MGAMAPPPHWIPEDDVLLKNAVEGGASLESLAKGAIQFSRRYTVQELQDRWSSLLYDPVVSEEASANMIEIERFGIVNQLRPNKLEGVNDIVCSSRKRKAESVRKYYYGMRKRICNEPFRIINSDILENRGPNCIARSHSFPEFGPHAAESTENSLRDLPMCNFFESENLVNEAGACSEFVDQSFHSFGCPSPLNEMPIWHTSQEISTDVLPIEIADADLQLTAEFMLPKAVNELDADAVGYDSGHLIPKLETPLSCDGMIEMTSSTQEYLEVLFNLSNDEGLPYMDNNENEAIEKSYLDGLSSLLFDSPKQGELSGSGLDEPAVATIRNTVVDAAVATIRNEVDGHTVVDAQVSVSGSTMKVGPEYCYGVICCILNTEDPEIPSNDDVFLPFRFPSPTNSSGPHWTLHNSSYLGSSSIKNFSSICTASGGPVGMKNTVPSHRMGLLYSSDASARYRREHGFKSENPSHVNLANVSANNSITGAAKGLEIEQGKSITSVSPCPDMKGSGRNVVDNIDEIPYHKLSHYDTSFNQTDVPKAIDHSLLSDQEELLSENEFDVPYFSDVEAMILDMDLSPDEFDLQSNPEVQRYQLEETKRTIIRLEQAADAFTQRVVNGHEAFAILYGRCSRHFIRKTEVLLGRETDDIKVDIDLGREKNGGKISRRQATIKMDMNGTFHLKNLGRTSIYINGKEVAPGHSIGLISGCLIEVRGLTFVFETNRKMIKQYVDGYTEGELFADHKPLRS